MMLGAAQLVHNGANPFDRHLLYVATDALLDPQNLPITPDRGIVRVGYPPLVYWALQPLADLPFIPVAWGWIASMWALAAVGFLATLRYLRWEHWAVPLALFLIAPPVVIEVYHANILAVVFAGVACALWSLRRAPLTAGVLLTATWIKPQVGLPIAALIILFHAPRPWRVATGLAAGSCCRFLLTLSTTGIHSLINWSTGLGMYAHDIAPQHVAASLSGVYILWAPLPLRFALTAFGILAACSLTARAWWTKGIGPVQIEHVAWLPFVWFLATPYAHVNDEMLLVIPLLAVIRQDGQRLNDVFPGVAVLLTAASAVPAAWSIVGLLPAAILLVQRAWGHPVREFAPQGAVLVLMILALAPFWLNVPVRKEPLLLMAAALCLYFAGASRDALHSHMEIGRPAPEC